MPLENSNFKTEIAALLARKDLAALKEKLATSLSSDIAPTLAELPIEQLAVLFRGCSKELSAAVFAYLDPVTKQVEVDVTVDRSSGLLAGQSVRIELPGAPAAAASSSGPVLLPLAAVKLSQDSRVVFTVADGALVAHPVELGAIHGDRVEITTPLAADLMIVTDARGLAEGERVEVASSTAP